MAAARECKTPDGLTVYDSSEVAKMNGSLFVLAHKHNAALAHLSASLAGAQAERETAELRKQALHAIHDELPDGQCRSGVEQVRELKADLAALRRENAELKKYKKRYEWLIEKCPTYKFEDLSEYVSEANEAIDTAMEGSR